MNTEKKKVQMPPIMEVFAKNDAAPKEIAAEGVKTAKAERGAKSAAVKGKGGYKKLNKSQKLSNKYRRQLKRKFGKDFVITDAQMRIYKAEKKVVDGMKSSVEFVLYFKRLGQLHKSESRQMIILMSVVWTIKGRLNMPKNTVLFKERSVAMLEIQVLNTSGYYTVAFAGISVWILRNSALDNGIKQFNLGQIDAAAVKALRKNVQLTLNQFLIYLNNLALANQSNAESIIETALCVVTKKPVYDKQDFGAKQGKASAQVILTCLAAKIDGKYVDAVYYWQYSLDNMKTWMDLEATDTSKNIVDGMVLDIKTYFRKRYKTKKNGMTEWCSPEFVTPR